MKSGESLILRDFLTNADERLLDDAGYYVVGVGFGDLGAVEGAGDQSAAILSVRSEVVD